MELIIDKKTKLFNIKNKEDYTKLTINRKINPSVLKDFINIKELVIKRYKRGFNVYNERHINELPFKDNIEKLTLDDIGNYGRDEKFNNAYSLLLPNLKEIIFIDDINKYLASYLDKCSSLEKVYFYRDVSKYLGVSNSFHVAESNLKNIVIDDKYMIDFDYRPSVFSFKQINSNVIEVNYNNASVFSRVHIDNEQNIILKEHSLNNIYDTQIENNILIIPDYVTNVGNYINVYTSNMLNGKNSIHIISLNLNLLKSQKEKTRIIGNYDINLLKKLIIRSNNEMSLYQNKEISLEKDLKELYIEDNKLHIVYEDKIILIDEFGKKTIKDLKSVESNKNLDNKEEYLLYKKLLEIIKKEEELINEIKVLKERIIKKLTK